MSAGTLNVRSNLKDESVSHQAIEEWKDCMGSILDAITSEDQTPWTGAQREQLVHLVHLVAQARKLLVLSSHEWWVSSIHRKHAVWKKENINKQY